MSAVPPEPPAQVLTRNEAIRRLRLALQPMCGPDRSMCDVAASQGIFCRGFRRWHDSEFHRKWKGALGTSTHLTRAQMERLADIWQLAEQVRCGVTFACDASARCTGPCRGWDEFTDGAIGRFCLDLLGERVVVSDRLPTSGLTPYLGVNAS